MGKRKIPEDKSKQRTITLYPRHLDYIRRKFLNLSKFVQSKIDEEIQKESGLKAKR